MKKKAAVKAGVVLLVVMLFFTFFSNTIFYFTTPKVTISRASRGMIYVGDQTEFGLVVPNLALLGSSVYVVAEQEGILGKELRLSRVFVSVGTRGPAQSIISDGLTDGDYVVTGWDRPIKDGQRVLLP